MAKKQVEADAPEISEEELKQLQIIERRLQNPLGESSQPIELTNPELVCRWFNAAIIADKVWKAKNKGWLAVRVEQLADPDQVGGFTKSPEGYVTRGDKGAELLMCMPKKFREKIEWAKAEANLSKLGSESKTKADLTQAAAEQFGDRASEYLDKHVGPIGRVTDSYERIQRTPGGDE